MSSNDNIFLTCPKCHKTKSFSYYYEIAYVCDCGYCYQTKAKHSWVYNQIKE